MPLYEALSDQSTPNKLILKKEKEDNHFYPKGNFNFFMSYDVLMLELEAQFKIPLDQNYSQLLSLIIGIAPK